LQATQITNGVFREMTGKWCTPQLLADTSNESSNIDPVGSILFFQLINYYLPSPSISR